ESRSRPGNVAGEISDGDPATFVVTFDGQPSVEDWYAVSLDVPVSVRRIVFAHGKTFHDGGWFNASAGKPRVEVELAKGGPWEKTGDLVDYPPTPATDPAGLKPGQAFTLLLPEALSVVGVRVIGKPATGDNPRQAFSSCAELQAFSE